VQTDRKFLGTFTNIRKLSSTVLAYISRFSKISQATIAFPIMNTLPSSFHAHISEIRVSGSGHQTRKKCERNLPLENFRKGAVIVLLHLI